MKTAGQLAYESDVAAKPAALGPGWKAPAGAAVTARLSRRSAGLTAS